jgi:hypothetical protein
VAIDEPCPFCGKSRDEIDAENGDTSRWPMSRRVLIPDADTALKIGRAILERYYGVDFMRAFEPYKVMSQEETWLVVGTDPQVGTVAETRPNTIQVRFGGGFPQIAIAKKDARVAQIALAR